MERTSRTWQTLGALLVGVLTPGIGNANDEGRLLTNVAHPSAVKTQWGEGATEDYLLSPSKLLRITTEEAPTEGSDLIVIGAPVVKKWKGSADIFDTRTGVKIHLDGLTRLLHRTTVAIGPDQFEASPDGIWLFWKTHPGLAIEHAAHLDGTHYRKWNCLGETDFFLDARHLVEISGYEPVMIVLDLLNPKMDCKHRTPSEQTRAVLTKYAAQQPVFLDVSAKKGLTTQGYASITVYRTVDRIEWLLHHYDPSLKAPQAVETHEIKLPEGAALEDSEVSPDQQSILYVLKFSQSPPHSLKPTRAELWISRANGQGLHEIGYILAGSHGNDRSDIDLFAPHWLPDGKQISFICQDAYYFVDARME